jgi:uncharacterized RDD family membrane protein YckC
VTEGLVRATPPTVEHPPAGIDRRFYAFAIDRGVTWAIEGLALVLAWRMFFRDDQVGAGIAVVVAAVLLVTALFALQLGLTGTSPGKAALGLRVLRVDSGSPLGLRDALLRTVVVGLATLPTFGLGAACLAWTATTDTGRRRRGWHDQVSGAVVVDVRPVPEVVEEADPGPRHVVNLTAMRLMPPAGREAAPGVDAVPTTAPTSPTSAAVRGGVPSLAGGRWRLAFDSGETFVVDGLVLVGRRPEPRPGEVVHHVVALTSGDMSLSKTHAQVEVAADGVLVVTDRGSTNGSLLLRAGASRQLSPGSPSTLLAGDEVRFGDRRMTVTRES